MDGYMNASAISKFAAGTVGGIIAFFVALLPERIKERRPFVIFQSNAAHIISGLSECALALALFVYGYDQFMGGFSTDVSRAVAAGGAPGGLSEAEFRGMGVFGFAIYLLHPIALSSFYMAIEGIVRAFTACATGRGHGIAALWAIDRIALFARRKMRKSALRRQLGPDEPDVLSRDETSGALILTSVENKDWRERQVARCGDDFYILSSRSFVPVDPYHRYRYTFRPIRPGEIIRGRIAVLPSASCL